MAKVDPRVAIYNALYESNYPAELRSAKESAVVKALPVGQDMAAQTAASGFAGAKATAELKTLADAISARPALEKLMTSVGSKMDDTTPVARVIVQKWKQDPTILDKIEKDLQGNPAAAKALTDRLSAHPENAAATLQKYNGSNFNDISPIQVAAAPSASAPAPETRKAASTAAPAKTPSTPVPQRASPMEVAAGVAAGAAPAMPPPPPLDMARMDKDFFTGLATKSDADISVALSNPAVVKGIAAGIADQATKMGVGAEYTKSFKDRMARDPQLVDAFQKNLQQNPEFVRQMAKTMRDGGEMPASMKEIAKKTMQDVMEQPEKLADDGFVKRMSQGLSMKDGGGMGGMGGMMGGLSSMFKGMGDMGGMFSGLGAFFQGIMDKIQSFIKEVSGGEWLSRRNSGRDFFQAFSDTIDQTPNRLASEANAKKSMVIHPAIRDGKVEYAHAEPVRDEKGGIRMGADGKELTGIKANTFEVTTISGSKMQVLPATGVPAVRDAQGNYHMNVVTGMDGNNRPTDVQQVVLSVDQFRAYNANIKQYGDPSMPPQYSMADNNVANTLRVGANVTTVDASGAIGKTINTAEVAAANPAPARLATPKASVPFVGPPENEPVPSRS